MADCLEGILGLSPVGGNASPMIEITHFTKRDGTSDLIHLVNGSGHFGVSFFAPVAMRDVVIELSEDRNPSSVKGLVIGTAVPFRSGNGILTLTAPRLDLFEAVQITW